MSENKNFIITQNCLIDLHLHLDGSISLKSARELAKLQNIKLPENDKELEKLLMVSEDCRDLNEYLEKFSLPVSLMQTKESIEFSAYNLCEELKSQGLIYAEIRFAPQKHCEKGLSQEDVVLSAIKGIKKSNFYAQLILCCMRDEKDNSKENIETVELTKKYIKKGVCACDLAGAEALYPNEKYDYIFKLARNLNIPFTIHSGEALGADSINIALDYGAKRIGHGIRAIENENVVNRLINENVAIEVCPTSNINTCVYDKISDMPIIKLISKGVTVTINSDNTSVSHTNIRKELQNVVDNFNLSKKELKGLLINSAKASFTDEITKENLKKQIEKEFCYN